MQTILFWLLMIALGSVVWSLLSEYHDDEEQP